MSLWGAYSHHPPFAGRDHLHTSIDGIPFADIVWKAFVVTYTGPKPTEGEIPGWMEAEYTVYYRCPREVIHAQLGNRDLHNDMDLTPTKVYQGGERVLNDFMTGDWVWTQAVSTTFESLSRCGRRSTC